MCFTVMLASRRKVYFSGICRSSMTFAVCRTRKVFLSLFGGFLIGFNAC